MYSVDRVDGIQEMEKRAEWAALVSVTHSAHCPFSSATSTLSTLYKRQILVQCPFLVFKMELRPPPTVLANGSDGSVVGGKEMIRVPVAPTSVVRQQQQLQAAAQQSQPQQPPRSKPSPPVVRTFSNAPAASSR